MDPVRPRRKLTGVPLAALIVGGVAAVALFGAMGYGGYRAFHTVRCRSLTTPRETRIASCERACRWSASDCRQLGDALLEHPTSRERAVRAETALQYGCNAGDSASCESLATLLRRADLLAEDPVRAFRATEKACKLGSRVACLRMGLALYLGTGVTKDEKAGVAHFAEACRVGTSPGCAWYGRAFRTGIGVEQDLVRAQGLYRAQCEDSKPYHCTGFAIGLAGLDRLDGKGPQAPSDGERAVQLLVRGCDLGEGEACYWIGYMRRNGYFVEKNQVAAHRDLRLGCNFDDVQSCAELGTMLSTYASSDAAPIEPDDARAVPLLQRACEGGVFGACDWWGLRLRNGKGVETDLPGAFTAFERGCGGGHVGSCTSVGSMLLKGEVATKDDARGFRLVRAACESGDADGCDWLAHAYMKGLGVERDDAASFAARVKACDGKVASACVHVGNALLDGMGTKKDPAAAKKRYAEACALGEEDACE